MAATIHYIAAAYLGVRHFMDPRFVADRWYYLRSQVEMLGRLKHSLDAITFVINTDALVGVPADIASVARIIQRPNIGMSYGAYAHAFATFGDQYSHYILNEDDYLFTQDDFDTLLLKEMESRPKCELLCGTVYEHQGYPFCPAVSCMIVSSKGLEVIASHNGGSLPHHPVSVADPYGAGYESQKRFSDGLVQAGYKVEDWLLKWSTAFRMDDHSSLCTRWFSRRGMIEGSPHRVRADFKVPAMVVSAQAVNVLHPISDGFRWHDGTIRKDGSVSFAADNA